ncbi:MAG: hypothetical protein OXC42_03025 [Gammaproteobacteria bacterium]|nr:hypothetical protein [Gammaproteobacteria bacterium]
MVSGGISNKLGNEYERKWTVRMLLEVIAGEAISIRYEGVSQDYFGFEFALHRSDYVEWHQVKRNAPGSNWTPNALKSEGVLNAFKKRLSSDSTARCVFVSQDPARQLRELSEEARRANDAHEFLDAVSKRNKEIFDDLSRKWDADKRYTFKWLCRCEFQTESEQSIDKVIAMHGNHVLKGEENLYPPLSDYLIDNLNALVTTEAARTWVRKKSTFTFRPAALDPTLREDIDAANQRYLDSYTPFGIAGQQIARSEVGKVVECLQAADGPPLIFLTGDAGSGKSGVVRGIMTDLMNQAVPCLAFRIDRYLSYRSSKKVGDVVLGRDESPVSALANLAGDKTSALIIDQIDAVSEVSGRNSAIKDILFDLVREAQLYADVRCILVCRTFDLENDHRYRNCERQDEAIRVQVPSLSWEQEVVPILKHGGIATESFTDSQRELLTLPINLSIFLEIGNTDFSFTTRTELFQKLVEKKARDLSQDRDVKWSVRTSLSSMAKWMSDNQELSAPYYVLGDFNGVKDWLASEGLIVIEQNRLSFFHESFFDFVFAQHFAQSGDDIIAFLTSTEQHLFRRTQVRQILTLMRDTEKSRYLKALETVLTDPRIRSHIKHSVAQWLATLDSPMPDELEIIQLLDDGEEEFPILMCKALFASEFWFDLLNDNGELSNMLRTAAKPRKRYLLGWLSRIVDMRPGPIAILIRDWWGLDPAHSEQVLEWFCSMRRIPEDRALIALLSDVTCSTSVDFSIGNRWGRLVEFSTELSEFEPRVSSGILQRLFEQWFKHNPGKHPFNHDGIKEIDVHDLAKLAEKAPDVFLEGMIPVLNKSVLIALSEDSPGYSTSIHVLYDSRSKRGPNALFSLYRDALRRLAQTSPSDAASCLEQLDPASHGVLLHLHLETISTNPSALGHRFTALLDKPNLFLAGLEGAEWKAFADAARSVVEAQCLPVQDIESKVFQHCPECDLAKEISHEIKEHQNDELRRNALTYLARSGHVEWCVLKTIGHGLLSSQGKERLMELERKFCAENVPVPRSHEAHLVDSPIPSDATSRMTDTQWRSAMERYNSEDIGLRNRTEPVGGALELARELERCARSDPNRFTGFFLKLPESVNPIYGQHVLQGLADADHLDKEMTIAALQAAHAHQNRPFGWQVANLVMHHPACIQDDDIFEMILWYAEHGEAREVLQPDLPQQGNEISSIHDLDHVNYSLITNGINSVRGLAWEVLLKFVESDSQRIARIWELLELRAVIEPFAFVRAMMVYPLVSLYSLDIDRFDKCLRLLTKPVTSKRDEIFALSPLSTNIGIRLFSYIERDLPELASELMERLINSPDGNQRVIGVFWTLAERLRQGNSVKLSPDIHEQSLSYLKLWAEVLCEFAPETEFRNMAISELEKLFPHGDPQVRKAAGGVFWNIPSEEFPYFMSMTRVFIRSPACEVVAPGALIRILKEASCDVTEIVIEVGEKLIMQEAGYVFVHELLDILKREYVNTENRSDLRKRILDLIDYMCEKNLYGVDDLMGLDDR